jgi:hypothetical protein
MVQANTFEEREWDTSEKARWQVAFDLGPAAQQSIRNHPLRYYQDTLAEVRPSPQLIYHDAR